MNRAQTLLMVRPAAFGFNAQTAPTNAFQKASAGRSSDAETELIGQQAIDEFDRLVDVLRRADVEVIVVDDTPKPQKPDAVFPCNWVSFHADGTVILYPMNAPIRRPERRPDIIRALETEYGFKISRVVDLTVHERESRFLEGSGSLVFDEANRVVHASLSARTDADLANEVAGILGYELVLFSATDKLGTPVYHTDVVMAIGTEFVVVAAELIRDERERRTILDRLASTGRGLILISSDQFEKFAGNLLEVRNREGRHVIVMSDAAHAAFDAVQIDLIGRSGRIVRSALPTIESVGGGSARCMIADIRLSRVSADKRHRQSD